MPMKRLALVDEALKLDVRSRAELAKRLLESLEELSEAEIDALWLEEAERRDQAMDEGSLPSIPAEEVFSRAKAPPPDSSLRSG